VKKQPDARTHTPQRSSHDLQISSSEARRTAKSPLVLKLLEEQEQTDFSVPLVYAPTPQLQPGAEEDTVYYHQAHQDIAGGVPEYAEKLRDAHTDKVIEVYNYRFVSVAALTGVFSTRSNPRTSYDK
jgi:hypothetical protein